ncbi:ThiF family adenylyltransferase [Qipengyuania sediminis]|uniref:ThiF family adenylyltransferase n=1 Tax=Qipengyuania sediminis TaxID=1532023 RepID=UPI00105A5D4F
MPDPARSLAFRQAALDLEARLRGVTGVAPDRLSDADLQQYYPGRDWAAGWRVPVTFSDGRVRHLDLVASGLFPLVPIRTALRERPEFMTWPHVERDGTLCLLPNLAECDPDDPMSVAENLLIRSIRLIEELIEGSIVDRDFREEFLTYWAYRAHSKGDALFSLLRPGPPSRPVKLWRGEGLEVVGEDAESLSRWLRNRFEPGGKLRFEDAAFLWAPEPPLPGRYPESGADLLSWAREMQGGATDVLRSAASSKGGSLIAIIGAEGRGGPGLVAVTALNPKARRRVGGMDKDPLVRGFRHRTLPEPLLTMRLLGSAQVLRSGVSRADALWIHGRGRDARAANLLGQRAVVVGCGSVGAPIAIALARAGVGRITLVDPDELGWANVGRHPLGAAAVGASKAEALAEQIKTDLPHLEVEACAADVRSLILRNDRSIEAADLIIAATGSWGADHAINRWHMSVGRRKPVIYGWTEAHALAGHGVVIAGKGGCFQCHMDNVGRPRLTAVGFPEQGVATLEEPACGAHYQPYGPVELAFTTTMLSEMALDCLIDPPLFSQHRIIVASRERVEALGGTFSPEFEASTGNVVGSGIATLPWEKAACPACEEASAEIAA